MGKEIFAEFLENVLCDFECQRFAGASSNWIAAKESLKINLTLIWPN